MSSLVDDLNLLLARERGEAEAVIELVNELSRSDPEMAGGAKQLLDTASWSCSGLYHRISQLKGLPSLESGGLAEEIADEPSAKKKIERLCAAQLSDQSEIASVLRRRDLDRTTRVFLRDLLSAHEQAVKWCRSRLGELVVDI